MKNDKQEIIIYQTPDGKTKLDVRFEGDSAWLNQLQMAELFDTTVANINIHIKNIFEEDELQKETTIKDYLIVQ